MTCENTLEIIFIGTIIGLKGLDGTMKVQSEGYFEIPVGSQVCVGFSERYSKKYYVLSWKPQIRGYSYVKLQGINSAELAKAFVEKGIYCSSKNLLKPKINYEQEIFSGFVLIDYNSGTKIGEVIGIQPNPGNDLLIANIKGMERLIPFVEAFIAEIDSRQKVIYIKLIDGLV